MVTEHIFIIDVIVFAPYQNKLIINNIMNVFWNFIKYISLEIKPCIRHSYLQ